MKMVESADGTIQVIELDPAKKYWIVLEEGGLVRPGSIHWRGEKTGLILTRRPGESFTLIENPEAVVGVLGGSTGSRESQEVREAAQRAIAETEGV